MPDIAHTRALLAALLAAVISLSWQASHAGPLRDALMERRAAQQQDLGREDARASDPPALPAGVQVLRDIRYGSERAQRMDAYLPAVKASGAPVILMVHGGAWRFGDKGAQAVVENKVGRWVSRGFIFISTNYRMLPKAAPLEQARDIARALAAAQGKAAEWGGDPARFILVGHSAGAHLVALLAASPATATRLGAQPWLGTISLDSAALDVVQIMEAKHARFYDQAFGGEPAYWKETSPFHALSANATPFLAVCSTRRGDSCPQARHFAARAASLKLHAGVLEQDLSHKDINQKLGLGGGYTDAVEAFMAGLDESVARALRR